MRFVSSYAKSRELFNKSVYLSHNWISKYWSGTILTRQGVSIEKIQAFSQHHFFSCLLEGKPIDDIWSQYPKTTTKPLRPHFLKRIPQVLKSLTEPKANIGLLDPDTQIVFLASGRHLEDWQNVVFYLHQHFKVLVVGKIPDDIQGEFDKQKITAINLASARRFLTRTERFVDLLFFLRSFWKKQGKHELLQNRLWQKRLWYLRLEQFPEILALLKLAHHVFDKTKPALLITTSSNDTFGATFCKTAQKLNIPVAEIQHGYSTFPSDRQFSNCNYHLIWGKIPQHIFSEFPEKLFCVGSPFIYEVVKKNKNDFGQKKTKRILVLWSPPMGIISLFQSKPNNQTLKELVQGLIKLPKNFKITIRSHPSYDIKEDLLGINLPPNIKVSSSEKVEKVIRDHDLVITQPTTAGFVAAVYKKPLIFFNNSWITQEFGDPIVNSDSALNVDLAKLREIDQYILRLTSDKNLLKKQQLAQEKFVREYCSYFGDESISQINLFAKKIIQDAHV